ncbi:hypothetical protein TCON_1596 [Astathelohania contejeani]|uniref:Uncharacterized protein n=1 Tax=Astathelohania contejeani TaxID=164912 RepID=A0ABQ7HYE7_9MICR|nr:hypothetical protein TCON_1596 [Thelohania contejeani]
MIEEITNYKKLQLAIIHWIKYYSIIFILQIPFLYLLEFEYHILLPVILGIINFLSDMIIIYISSKSIQNILEFEEKLDINSMNRVILTAGHRMTLYISILLFYFSRSNEQYDPSYISSIVNILLSLPIMPFLYFMHNSFMSNNAVLPNCADKFWFLILLLQLTLLYIYPGLTYYFFYSHYQKIFFSSTLIGLIFWTFIFIIENKSSEDILYEFITYIYLQWVVPNTYQLLIFFSSLLSAIENQFK